MIPSFTGPITLLQLAKYMVVSGKNLPCNYACVIFGQLHPHNTADYQCLKVSFL